MSKKNYNEGMYADEKIANEWNLWVKDFKSDDTRDRAIYPYLSKWIAENEPKKILEIGSGQGVCFEKINLYGATYIGIEPSKHLRDLAAKLYPKGNFIPGKAEDIPLPDKAVNAAFSVFVLFHISDLEKAAKELARVLPTGGIFTIITANPDQYKLWLSWHTNIKKDGKKVSGDMKRLSGHIMYLHTMGEIKKSITDANLVITNIEYCGGNDNSLEAEFAVIISGYKA